MIGNSLRWELNAFTGFLERQKNLYRRYWAWEAVWLLYNLVSVLSIGYLASGLSTLGLEPGHSNLQQAQLYRSEEHTSELQSRVDLVCRLLLEKKKKRHRKTSQDS